ncbi:MAG: hypothetical protein K5697_00195, partial [Lachnospiraceae bacterium]|nr:hypothetical protein [Lachnospiraceae bacterium]
MMGFDEITEKALQMTLMTAAKLDSQLVTPEHFLYVCTDVPVFIRAMHMCGGSVEELKDSLDDFLHTLLPRRTDGEPDGRGIGERISDAFAGMIEQAVESAEHMG